VERTADVVGGFAEPGRTKSAAVKAFFRTLERHLIWTSKWNGVRIAALGGIWGMDDMLKSVSAGRLEPYFRLQPRRERNIIRNWLDMHGRVVL